MQADPRPVALVTGAGGRAGMGAAIADSVVIEADPADAAGIPALFGRRGTTQDTANLVSFLCSAEGGWVTGQILYSNRGFHGSIG